MTIQKRTNCIDGELCAIPLIYNDNSEASTLFELPANWVITAQEMWLVVDTVDASETIEVGIGMGTETGYDSDGFIDGYSLATAGYYRVADMFTCTDGSNQNYISANYIGDLFFAGLDGSNASGAAGIMATKSYRGDGTCKTFCYTCSADSDTFTGWLLFVPRALPFLI